MESLAENRRARFDYDILETLEAGIELKGHEVKSVKAGRMGIAGSRVVLRGGEAWLLGASVPPYQPLNVPAGYDPSRSRRLLLTRTELGRLAGALREKSATLIPLRAYQRKNLVKLELGLVRGRSAHDKRELLKKKAASREMRERG